MRISVHEGETGGLCFEPVLGLYHVILIPLPV